MEPLKQELTELRDGDKSFEVAIQGAQIAREPIENIKQVLRLVMVKVGLRAANWPTDEEKLILIEHIITNYGGHTTKEILLAFDMGISGRLEFEEKESIQCYENFSCLYFSSVMNAYRKWAKDQHREIKPLMIEDTEPLTNQTMQDWYTDTKNQVIKRTLTIEFISLQLYEWAVSTGLLKPTNSVKWEYLRMAIEYRQAQLYADMEMDTTHDNQQSYFVFMKMKAEGGFQGSELIRLRNLAKKMLLFDEMLK